MSTERIVYVEYQDGRPFEVVTRDDEGGQDHYDIEYCKRDDQLYYDLAGFGAFTLTARAGTTFWAAPDCENLIVEKGAVRLAEMPKEHHLICIWPGEDMAGHIEDPRESDCVYCSICDDWLPGDDTDHPCEHVWWCDEAAWWSTPGERCPAECEDCRERGRETRATIPT